MVNVSSVGSRIGLAPVIYSSSKAALDQITRCMAVELGPHNIRVNSINPAQLDDTPMSDFIISHINSGILTMLKERIPFKRFVKTEEVVNAVLYLLSDNADMINGALLPVDGGKWCS